MNANVRKLGALAVSIAKPSDGPELTLLLQDSYRLSTDFTVREDSYFHDHFSGRSAVVLVRSGGELLGMMRASLISCSADLAFEDEDKLSNELAPAIYLSRAATVRDGRIRGVNSMMRLYCIEAAIELGLKSVVGFVYQDASRTKLMSALGYSFSHLSSKGNAVLTDHSQCLFAQLSLKECGDSGLHTLRTQIARSETIVTWEGASIADTLIAHENQDAGNSDRGQRRAEKYPEQAPLITN